MHGAGLCLLWPLGPTLEFRVWAFLVWTFTCEASLLPGDQLAGLLLLLGTVMQCSHSVMMAVRMFQALQEATPATSGSLSCQALWEHLCVCKE